MQGGSRLRKLVPVFLAWAPLLAVAPAGADASRPDAAVTGYVGPGLMHYDFREYDADDRRLVKEEGWLSGLQGGLLVRRRRLSLLFEAAWYGGDVDYDGQTSAGVPIDSSTDESLMDLSSNLAYVLALNGPVRWEVFAGGGFRHWQRDIEGVGTVSGLDETYRWWRGEAGLRADLRRGSDLWTVSGRFMRSFDPEVDVDFDDRFDSVTLDMGERWGWRVEADWKHQLSERLVAGVRTFYASWAFGRSDVEALTRDGVPAGSVVQPRSEAREYGVALHLQRLW
jgi:hypothetical protein